MPPWSKLEFANDGKNLLLGTLGSHHYVIDSFKGSLVTRLVRDRGPTITKHGVGAGFGGIATTSGDVCWAPDGRYVIGGSGEKGVCVWDVGKGEPVEGCLRPMKELEYPKDGATCVAFNPRNSLFATARKEVVCFSPLR